MTPFVSLVALAAGLFVQPPVIPRSALSDPALSPDGSEMVFVAGGDLWTVAARGGQARELVAHPATESRPLWSPDGTRVAFVSGRTGGGDIYVLELATGRLSRRTFDDGREQLDSWSRDGAWLYYSTSSGDISGMNDIWRVPANGGQPAVVAGDRYASEYWAAPSPDGTTLAITARGTVAGQWWRHGHSHIDESEIWLVSSLDSTTPTYQAFGASGGAKEAWPMWSADGKTVYHMSDRGGHENLWAHRVGSDNVQALTRFTSGRVLWPQIAYDGSAIVFERDYGIWRYDVAQNTAAEVPITLRGSVAEPNAERANTTNSPGAQQADLSSPVNAYPYDKGTQSVGSAIVTDTVKLPPNKRSTAKPSRSMYTSELLYNSNHSASPSVASLGFRIISVITMSYFPDSPKSIILRLISSVMCGMTCTVLPK